MVHDGMDNGQDVGVEDQPTNQQSEATQQVPKKERESLVTRAAKLFVVRGQPMKRRKLASDTTASLDYFCKFTRRIEELKLEAAFKLHRTIWCQSQRCLN